MPSLTDISQRGAKMGPRKNTKLTVQPIDIKELTATSAIIKLQTRTKGIVGYIVPTQPLFPDEKVVE